MTARTRWRRAGGARWPCPGLASNGSGLVEGLRRGGDLADARGFGRGARDGREMRVVAQVHGGGGPRGEGREDEGEAEAAHAYWNTASGLSRLSDPSKAIWSRPSVETARSIDRVWAISASTAPITSASPAALSPASIWS